MTTSPYFTFGKTIKRLRKNKQLTQQELANSLGCSRLSVIQIEAGRKDISVTQLTILSKIFNIPTCRIISNIEDCQAYQEKISHIKQILSIS